MKKMKEIINNIELLKELTKIYFENKNKNISSSEYDLIHSKEFKIYIDTITNLSKMSYEEIKLLWEEKVENQNKLLLQEHPEYESKPEKFLNEYTSYQYNIERLYGNLNLEHFRMEKAKNKHFFNYETTLYTLENTISDKKFYDTELNLEMLKKTYANKNNLTVINGGGYYNNIYSENSYDLVNPFTNKPLSLCDENVLYVHRFNGYTFKRGTTLSPWLKKYLLEKYIPLEKIRRNGQMNMLGEIEKELELDKENNFLQNFYVPDPVYFYLKHLDINVCEYRFYVLEDREKESQGYYIGFCHEDKEFLIKTIKEMDEKLDDRVFQKVK